MNFPVIVFRCSLYVPSRSIRRRVQHQLPTYHINFPSSISEATCTYRAELFGDWYSISYRIDILIFRRLLQMQPVRTQPNCSLTGTASVTGHWLVIVYSRCSIYVPSRSARRLVQHQLPDWHINFPSSFADATCTYPAELFVDWYSISYRSLTCHCLFQMQPIGAFSSNVWNCNFKLSKNQLNHSILFYLFAEIRTYRECVCLMAARHRYLFLRYALLNQTTLNMQNNRYVTWYTFTFPLIP